MANGLLIQTFSYALLGILFFVVINWLSGGFFYIFIRVKMSRGKYILVMVHSLVDKHYRIGTMRDGMLRYTSRMGDKKSISKIPKKAIYYSIGVKCIEVDEETNGVVTKDFTGVDGHDAQKVDDTIERAIRAPQVENNVQKGIYILIIVLIIGGIGYLAYKNMQLIAEVGIIKTQLADLLSIVNPT